MTTRMKLRYDYEPGYCGELLRENGTSVCTFSDEPTSEDARRLVACWNACAEISTETLEERGPGTALAVIAARAIEQRGELLEALERAERKLTAYIGVCSGDKELTDAVLPMARAAIARATHKEQT